MDPFVFDKRYLVGLSSRPRWARADDDERTRGMTNAPGWPGITARWTSAGKSGVGTALNARSRVCFTLSHGILNEIYYPRIDQACTRDFGLVVADGSAFFSEEKRHCNHTVELVEDGVPAFRLSNTCLKGRYRIAKTIIADPLRDVVLQRIQFEELEKPGGAQSASLRLYALLSPHLVNRGAGNTGWIGEYKGHQMLFAEGGGTVLALASSVPWRARSVGFVGKSDGWHDLSEHRPLQLYDRAEDGNIALTGEIDLRSAKNGVFELALGFGRTQEEAALRARASLINNFDNAMEEYARDWRHWQDKLRPLDKTQGSAVRNAYRTSTMVLRCHEATSFSGGMIASLAIPWGFSKGDDDLGGYHLVWPRDLVQTATALLAADAHKDAVRVLSYLAAVQEADGHWPQNMWLDGTSYWHGVQLDECAFPILLFDLAARCGALGEGESETYWPMVQKAAAFIVQNGPSTGEDRWEENGGFSVFTLAVEIAALLAAADLADSRGEQECAAFLRDTADDWNDRIETLTYASDGPLAAGLGIDGYYVRITPSDAGTPPIEGSISIKNRPAGEKERPAASIVSPDALALVRFGLRAADDPRILNTIKVIDALLKVEFPSGPAWRRYSGDGYGEHADGAPFDGTGTGRAWPLLTGERAHFELAAGHLKEAKTLLATLESFSSDGSMIPEQVWDAEDIPERELFFGKPSGSAMPLVWAHAEHIKLRRSIADGRVFDMPPHTVKRYLIGKIMPTRSIWRENDQRPQIKSGLDFRVELREPSTVHWSDDAWGTTHDTETWDSGLGVHVCDIPTAKLPDGSKLVFTFLHLNERRWAGIDYEATVE